MEKQLKLDYLYVSTIAGTFKDDIYQPSVNATCQVSKWSGRHGLEYFLTVAQWPKVITKPDDECSKAYENTDIKYDPSTMVCALALVSILMYRLRDIPPSHITSLNVTPSEIRTLEVLTSGHYTFGKFHLRNITPPEVTPLEVTPSDVSPSGHSNFAKSHTFHSF